VVAKALGSDANEKLPVVDILSFTLITSFSGGSTAHVPVASSRCDERMDQSSSESKKNLAHISWRFEAWVNSFPLNRNTVLDYFKHSEFYGTETLSLLLY